MSSSFYDTVYDETPDIDELIEIFEDVIYSQYNGGFSIDADNERDDLEFGFEQGEKIIELFKNDFKKATDLYENVIKKCRLFNNGTLYRGIRVNFKDVWKGFATQSFREPKDTNFIYEYLIKNKYTNLTSRLFNAAFATNSYQLAESYNRCYVMMVPKNSKVTYYKGQDSINDIDELEDDSGIYWLCQFYEKFGDTVYPYLDDDIRKKIKYNDLRIDDKVINEDVIKKVVYYAKNLLPICKQLYKSAKQKDVSYKTLDIFQNSLDDLEKLRQVIVKKRDESIFNNIVCKLITTKPRFNISDKSILDSIVDSTKNIMERFAVITTKIPKQTIEIQVNCDEYYLVDEELYSIFFDSMGWKQNASIVQLWYYNR